MIIFFFIVTARRLEKEVKQIMEDYSDDRETLEKLLTGRRVDLAEELSEYTLCNNRGGVSFWLAPPL